MFDFEDAMYGLRNVAEGDGEQERILDYVFLDEFTFLSEGGRNLLHHYIREGDGDKAYGVLFQHFFANEDPWDMLAHCITWADEFVRDNYDGEDVACLEKEKSRLAIAMWRTYCQEFHIQTIKTL